VSLIVLVLAFNAACCLAYAAVPKLFLALGLSGSPPTAMYVGEFLRATAKLVVVASVVLAVVLVFVSRLAFLIGLKKRARQVAADET
jgi:formate hydrogenlyase subunit 3/multisubunit Na+/H+ antiporter MnhD subunit